MYPTPVPNDSGDFSAGGSSAGLVPAGENRTMVNQNDKDKLLEKLAKLSDEKNSDDKLEEALNRQNQRERELKYKKEFLVKDFISFACALFNVGTKQLKALDRQELMSMEKIILEKAEKCRKYYKIAAWSFGWIPVIGWVPFMLIFNNPSENANYRRYAKTKLDLAETYGPDYFPFEELETLLAGEEK